MRRGIDILRDEPGDGPRVRRHRTYFLRLRLWLSRGDPVVWKAASGFVDRARLEEEGTTLYADQRIDRENLVNGLFYGIEGMAVGGTRTLRIAPHLAYGERGVPGVIPANALLVAEVHITEERRFDAGGSR